MRPEQLEELNAILRDPPVTGLALGRSLGCLVAARLAARHGITVRLRAGEGEGVAAYVDPAPHLLVEEQGEPRPIARRSVARARGCRPRAGADEPRAPRGRPLPRADFDAGAPGRSLERGGQRRSRARSSRGRADLVEPPCRLEPRPPTPATPSLRRRVPGRDDRGPAGADRRATRAARPRRGPCPAVALSLRPPGRPGVRETSRSPMRSDHDRTTTQTS